MGRKKKKEEEYNPFVGMSVEEVLLVEENNFLIQMDTDFFVYRGKCAFSSRVVDSLFEKIVGDFETIIETGDAEQVREARKCMYNTRVWPLRIH